MFSRLTVFFVICFVVIAVALPSDDLREKRDVADSMKSAGDTVAKGFSDAGDAIVGVFKPTEKSTLDKMADSVKNIGQ